jgi:hypothetical protein
VKQLRLVLVSRRFWPLVGGAERAVASLGVELVRRGAQVTILTARWEPAWPAEVTFSGIRVIRLPQPARRMWGTLRYIQALGQWIARHRGQYELVCVSML